MKNKLRDTIENWAGIFLGVLGVLAIISIFEDDSSKIISKKGRKFLSDDDRMKVINKKILESETKNQHKEVLI